MTIQRLYRIFLPQELLHFVRHGDFDMAASLASMLARPLLRRSKAALYLNDGRPAKRLLGLVRMAMELAWAADPEGALRLLRPLRATLEEGLTEVLGSPSLTRDVSNSLGSAAAFAALQVGSFDECLDVTATLLASRNDVSGQPMGWVADTRYEALIRTFQIAPARELRSRQPPDALDPTRRTVELDDMLDGLVPTGASALLLEPRPNFDWFVETRARIVAWVERQQQADRSLRESFIAIGLDAEDWSPLEEMFAKAAVAIATVAAVAEDESMPKADRDDVIQRGFHAHSSAVREILSPSTDRERTLHDNRHLLNYAAMVLALKAPTRDEAAAAISHADSARAWSEGVGDRYGEAMAQWALGCLHERAGDEPQALRAFSCVYARLVALRVELVDPAARGMLAGTFRTLIPRLVVLALQASNQSLAFEVLEFRRGLAVSSERSRSSEARPPTSTASYYAISVFEEYGVFGSLATGDGAISVERIAITPADLDPLIARSCPDTWHQGILRRDHSPRQALSPIMEPLERGAISGRIADGSHICVALDHPLHAMPIHYLWMKASMAVTRQTFSRAASFADFQQLVQAQKRAPLAATIVFIPASDVNDNAQHEASFALATGPILANIEDAISLLGTAADKDKVLAAAARSGLLHIHAHGVFPDAYPNEIIDPVTRAGILVAADGALPDRSDPEAPMLRTSDILGAAQLHAAHVSLATCVSGLGRPGRGGDMLGIEFALRLRGVGSVIACHWNVPHATAAAFFARFYEEWLGNGLGRGEAWRLAVLSIAEGAATEAEAAAAAGSFSLFGEWS